MSCHKNHKTPKQRKLGGPVFLSFNSLYIKPAKGVRTHAWKNVKGEPIDSIQIYFSHQLHILRISKLIINPYIEFCWRNLVWCSYNMSQDS